MMRRTASALFAFTSVLFPARAALAQDATVPGQPSATYPTFHNLSIEWPITGDDDADGTVTVRYRKQGEADFRDAMPLVRVPAGSNQGFSWQNRHAGSVFGLEPGTAYDLELVLADPDGGDAMVSLSASTRALPGDPASPNVVNVDPSSLAAALGSAAPGDILLLADGTYGSIVVPNDGADGQPIVLRAANAGGAVVDGEVRLDGRAFVHVDGLTINGRIKMNDARDVMISKCTIQTTADGIVSYGAGLTNAYIVDNVITGATTWY
ncbi:MAG: right-handed parallel beta-helix repeat-containing protein, partial [Myxococcales bacterium]|nr:right-handed parallel beta-helix repeat-containing protein [Myxococcales bacterium]